MTLPLPRLARLLGIVLAFAPGALNGASAADAKGETDSGYRLLDPRASVQVLATVPGESLVQLVADPAGRLFLGGREGVFVVEPGEVKPGLTLREIYRERGDHWFMGLAVRGDDLYVAKHDAVMVLPGAVKGRGPVRPRPIIWGLPRAKGWAFHQTLHDLKLGPDGKLYFTMGDPAWGFGDFRHPDHWFRTRFETAGKPAKRDIVSVGGLFRCEPADGSDLELVMTGTRNNCGFDWNEALDLFTTDNDHEQDARYCPGRLLFVVPGGLYNWPRGWMDDRPEDLPAVAGLGREVPVGLAVYADSRLPADYRGNVLIARWGQQRIDRFALERKGSGYTAREIPWLACPPGRRPMAVAVGRGGRVYALVSHMETNAESPTYTADLLEIDAKDGPAGFEGRDLTAASIDDLVRELSQPDLSRRMDAQTEIRRRKPQTWRPAIEAALSAEKHDTSWPHLLRLAAPSPQEVAASLLFDPPADSLSKDISPREARAILEDLWQWSAVVSPHLLNRWAESDDPYVRQLACRLLARNLATGRPNPGGSDPKARLASVLADGFFLTIPPVDDSLPEDLALAPSNYEDAPPGAERRIGLFAIDAWWKALTKTPAREAAFHRLVDALKDPDGAVRLQALRSLDRLNDPRALPALEALVDSPPKGGAATLDQVLITLARLGGPGAADRIVRALATAEGSTRRAAAEALVSLDGGPGSQSKAAAEALARLAKGSGLDEATRQAATRRLAAPDLLRTLVLDPHTPPDVRATALGRLAPMLDTEALGALLGRIEPDAGSRVLSPAARLAASRLEPRTALRLLGGWLEAPNEDTRREAAYGIASSPKPVFQELARTRLAAESSPRVVAPLAESLLSDSQAPDERDAALASLVRSRPDLDPALRRRLIEHLQQRPGYAEIAEQVGTPPASSSKVPAAFAGIDWSEAWKSGDPKRGRELFRAKQGVSCIACHRFRGEGGNNGPSLEEVGKRLSVPYMAESVLAPSAQVAPQYRPSTIALKSGEVLNGLVLQETPKTLTLGLADGTTRELAVDDVEERKSAETSIMPEGLAKSPQDLRDLLAYLLSPPEK
jgi:putative heme-binding domain-containing protein